jgi:hypothetical protein
MVVTSLAVVPVVVLAIGRWPRDRMASPSPAAVVGVRGSDVEMKLSSVSESRTSSSSLDS